MNTVTTSTVSLGSVTIGLSILAVHLTRWWRGGGKSGGPGGPGGGASRDPKLLIPLATSMALGMLAITSAGGLLGTVATMILHTGNTLGDWSLTAATGTSTPSVTRSGRKSLSPGGCAALVVYVVVLITLWRSGAKIYRNKIASGIVSGVLLGLSAGVSGVAAAGIVTLFNAAGDRVMGLM